MKSNSKYWNIVELTILFWRNGDNSQTRDSVACGIKEQLISFFYFVFLHNSDFHSSFVTYHLIFDYSNTTGTTSGAGTAFPSRSEFTSFYVGLCCSIFSFLCSVLPTIVWSFCQFSFGLCIVCRFLMFNFSLLLQYLSLITYTGLAS